MNYSTWSNMQSIGFGKCLVGFWEDCHSKDYADYPIPSKLINKAFYDKLKQSGIYYEFLYKLTNNSRIFNTYKGWSNCRICGVNLGSHDMVIGKYIYPCGLEHYIDEHNVLVPDWFINFVLGRHELTIADPETLDDWCGWANFIKGSLKG